MRWNFKINSELMEKFLDITFKLYICIAVSGDKV